MKAIVRTTILCIGLCTTSIASVVAQVLTLDSVLHLISLQNPMLQEFDSRVKAMNAYSTGAKSWMAPMVGFGTFMTPYPGQTVEHGDEGSVMFSVEQNIPNPSKLNASKKYLESKAAIEEQGRNYQFNTLRAEAKQVYYQWLVAEARLNILKENERTLELMLKLARIRYPLNQGSLGNIYKAEGRLQEVQNMVLMTSGEIDEYGYRLKTLTNLSTEAYIMIDTSLHIAYKPNQVLYDTASLSARSDVRQLDNSIKAMQLNQQLQKFQARPDFKVRFDHMQPLGSNMPAIFTAMAMVSIPIAPWSSKMYKSEIRGMDYEIDAMKRGREAILNETRGMLAGMAAQLSRMQIQLGNYQTKIIPSLRKNYQTLMLAYEENREQLPIVIDGWEALSMSQMDYLEKLDQYYTMIVRYEKELEK